MMQPPIRNTSFKMVRSPKVKFLSSEEVALLISGQKVSDRKTSSRTASQKPSEQKTVDNRKTSSRTACQKSSEQKTVDNRKTSSRTAVMFSEQKTMDKSQWNSFNDVRCSQAHMPDKEHTSLYDEIAMNNLTGGSGYVSGNDYGNTGIQEENFTNCLASETCWRGTFEVFDIASQIYNGIQAYISATASPKVCEMSKEMPKELKFKMLPRADVWPNSFQYDSPDKEDIGLYFFPSEQERPKEMYNLLLRWIDSRDFAMQSRICDVELLIFTSKHLPEDSQRIGGEEYLWGIFRNMAHKIDKPIPRLHARTSSAKATSGETDYVKGSFIKYPQKKVGCNASGFSRLPSSRCGITSQMSAPTGHFASSSTSGGYGKNVSKACALQVVCATNKSAKHGGMQLSSSCSKGKWVPIEAIRKRKKELRKKLDAISKHSVGF